MMGGRRDSQFLGPPCSVGWEGGETHSFWARPALPCAVGGRRDSQFLGRPALWGGREGETHSFWAHPALCGGREERLKVFGPPCSVGWEGVETHSFWAHPALCGGREERLIVFGPALLCGVGGETHSFWARPALFLGFLQWSSLAFSYQCIYYVLNSMFLFKDFSKILCNFQVYVLVLLRAKMCA